MPSTYTKIAATTLTSNSTTVTFTSLSSDYTDLIIVVHAKRDTGSSANALMTFNNDTSSNYLRAYFGRGTSTIERGTDTQAGNTIWLSTTWATYHLEVYQYSATDRFKHVNIWHGSQGIFGNGQVWKSTSAISTITFNTSTNNFASGSTFSIYGIKAA